MTTRSRSLAWDATTAIEALAAADTVLWIWTPAENELRFTGATRALGLGPLAPECTAAGFVALAMPQDRSLAERMLKPQEEGTEVAVRLRMRGSETCLWRGVWLEDGLRAAGVVALETKFAGSDRDTLTGLLDRRAFLARVGEVLTQAGEYEMVVGDVDRLRRLNEALGHERTDLVLSALGSRLAAAFPKDASPARIGEDEFAIIVPRSASHTSYRMRDALEQPLRVAGFDIYPTVSIGAVMVEGGPDAPDAAELLRRVELAVESAKSAGRGGSAAYGRALESDSLSRLALEADLRNAFVRGEIVPFFQPIVNLNTGAVAGFEALARWRHPRRGLVPPDEFLGLTADLGMMNELGLLMMTQSARQLAEWIERHPLAGKLFCSVNLSVGEIERPHLCEDVARVIKESGLPKGALKLEVTEGDIMRDTAHAAEVLQSLKDVGGVAGAGRLRHRLLVPVLSGAPAVRYAEDRPLFRADDEQGRRLGQDRQVGGQPGPRPVAGGRRRGGRERRTGPPAAGRPMPLRPGLRLRPRIARPGGRGLSGRKPGRRIGADQAAVGLTHRERSAERRFPLA